MVNLHDLIEWIQLLAILVSALIFLRTTLETNKSLRVAVLELKTTTDELRSTINSMDRRVVKLELEVAVKERSGDGRK